METPRRNPALVEDGPDGFRVTMRPPRNTGCLVAFLTVWLIGWTFGGISAVRALASSLSPFNPAALFLLLWLCGWVVGEVVAIVIVAFTIGGREVLTIDGVTLERRAEVFGRGLTWRYPLSEVSDFGPVEDSDGRASFIGFAYKDKRIRMGTNLDEASSIEICDEIWRRFPQLRATA